MRITHETMMRITKDAVDGAIRRNRSIIAAYLSGSLLEDEFQLGGTIDIDLFFVHTDNVIEEREVVALTEDVHLDIAHHRYRDYQNPRELRIHPWLGPVLNNAQIMYDPQHFLDFTQASVRGQFDRADYILERIQGQLEMARKIWFNLQNDPRQAEIEDVYTYIKAIKLIANAVASFSNMPLTERRFLLNFPGRAIDIGNPGLYHGFLGLLGAPNIEIKEIGNWLPGWERAYFAIPEDSRPVRLNKTRYKYYRNAFEAILKTDSPEAVLYPLMNTWLLAMLNLSQERESREECMRALSSLGLIGEKFEERVLALDAYLDVVEEIVENWAKANGVWEKV